MYRKRISIISSSKFDKNPNRLAWTGDNKKSKKKYLLSTWRLMLQHIAYCCRTTSVHGFQYLADPKCSKRDRLLWACVITAGLYATVLMISFHVADYYNNPIFYSHLAVRKLIRDIPFPAVTVCSTNQIPPSAFNYSKALLKLKDQLTEKERFQLDFANYFCAFGEQRENFYEHLNVSVINEIFKVRNDFCAEEFSDIKWQQQKMINPCDFLQQVLTWYGHCYTFNMVPLEQFYQPGYLYTSFSQSIFQSLSGETEAFYGWNQSEPHNWSKGSLHWSNDLPTTPWTTNDTSLTGGVIFTLNFRSHDFDDACSLGAKSFQVIVHPPDEVADLSHNSCIIRDNSVVLIKLFPEVVEHSVGLEALPPSRRRCYISGEKLLRFFQVYNQHNCEIECHANWSLQHCGCVAYFHPREEGTPVCNQAKTMCLIEVQRNMSERCNCLPSCSGIIYNTEFFYINKKKRVHPILDLTLVYVNFVKKGVTTKVADNIVRTAEVISNLGGLLCLFLGAGLISLLEMVYMGTLRPLVTMWNYHRRARKRTVFLSEMWSQAADRVTAWRS